MTVVNYTRAGTADDPTSGTGTWTCPAGVYSVIVRVWAAGAGGGGSPSLSLTPAGHGGGGGAFSESVLSVTPGNVYTLYVGLGGTGGGVAAYGVAGEDSWFVLSGSSAPTSSAEGVLAKGGARGTRGGIANADGQGGQASAGFGTTKFSGGNGGAANNAFGGGGGSSAGTGSNGNNASQQTGGSAPTGGAAGGNGVSGAVGQSGSAPGGAGAGGGQHASGRSGGAGANGQIQLEFTPDTSGFFNFFNY